METLKNFVLYIVAGTMLIVTCSTIAVAATAVATTAAASTTVATAQDRHAESTTTAATTDPRIVIQTGESRLIPAPQGITVRVKNGKAIKVEEQAKGILITGRGPGTAKVIVEGHTYEIVVQSLSSQLFVTELKDLIRRFRGLILIHEKGLPKISGRLLRVSDWQNIAQLARSYGAPYIFAATPDRDVEAATHRFVEHQLAKEKLPPLSLSFSPQATLRAPKNLKNTEEQLRSTLQPLGIDLKYDQDQLAIAPLVRVKIVVAEINKSFQQELGFDWPEEISATLSPEVSKNLSIEVALKMMEEKGEGQILASPSLLARSGSSADFLAGGEFAIKVVSNRVREVLWKRHGIYLQIKPVADHAGSLSIELTTEVSLIDGSQTIEGVPALKTNRMSTHFDLHRPRTIILSGLIRNDWSNSRSQVPLLGDIPVLGALFRSDNFNRRKSELVIFVTPEIVAQNQQRNDEEQSDETPEMPKGWKHEDF